MARKILLDQLTGQARSRAELATKLARKGVPEEVAERLLDRFEEVGLVDDAAFAALLGRVPAVRQGAGPPGAGAGAAPQGHRRRDRAEALAEVDDEDEDASARVLVRRKLRSVAAVDRATAVRRLSGMLARKGYRPGVAFRVVKEELEAAGHGDPRRVAGAVTDADRSATPPRTPSTRVTTAFLDPPRSAT